MKCLLSGIIFNDIFRHLQTFLFFFSGEHQFMIRAFSRQCLAKLMFKRRESLASHLFSKYETYFYYISVLSLDFVSVYSRITKIVVKNKKLKKPVIYTVFLNFQPSSHFNYLWFQLTFNNLKYFSSINIINSTKLSYILKYKWFKPFSQLKTFKISFQ